MSGTDSTPRPTRSRGIHLIVDTVSTYRHFEKRCRIGRFKIILGGRSHGTVMLHGPLEVWEGVRGDVDWRQ